MSKGARREQVLMFVSLKSISTVIPKIVLPSPWQPSIAHTGESLDGRVSSIIYNLNPPQSTEMRGCCLS